MTWSRLHPLAAAIAVAGTLACSPGPVVELALPPGFDRAWISTLHVLAVDDASPLFAGDPTPDCSALTAYPARRGHRDLEDQGRDLKYPLEAGEAVVDVDGDRPGRVLVHLVARGPAAAFAGNVARDEVGAAKLRAPREEALAEACACLSLDGADEDCLDGSEPQTLVLADLLASSDVVAVTPLGPTQHTVVRGTRAALSPGARVAAPLCAGLDTPGCLDFEGAARLDGLPVSVRVEGDPDAAPVAAIVTTNAQGDVVPEIEVGACTGGSMRVHLALIGHPTAATTFEVQCIDDLPPPRAPVTLASYETEDLRMVVVPTRPASLAVLTAEDGGTVLTWLTTGARPQAQLRFAGEMPSDVVAFTDGEPRVVVATSQAGEPVLRAYRATGQALAPAGEQRGECRASLCAAVLGSCNGAVACDHPSEARLGVGDLDGDGHPDVTLVSTGGGITRYDSALERCGRITGLGSTHLAHTWPRFGGGTDLPTMVTVESLAVRFTYPSEASASGPPCASDAECTGGARCHVPCATGPSCGGGPIQTGVCLRGCDAGASCPVGTTCTRIEGGTSACLGPGPSCVQGQNIDGSLSSLNRSVAVGRLRPGDRDDVVVLARGGAPRVLWADDDRLDGRPNPARDAILAPRAALDAEAPRDARAVTTGDVDGDGLDDVVVAYETAVRVWLGSAGLPGETTAAPMPACAVRAVVAGDFDGNGKAEIAVACGTMTGVEIRVLSR